MSDVQDGESEPSEQDCAECGDPVGDNPRRRVGTSELLCSRECSDAFWGSGSA